MNSRRLISHPSDKGRTLAHRQPRIVRRITCTVRCPSWVKSGNAHNEPMMSAFHPIATEQRTQFYVGFVPIADIGRGFPGWHLLPQLPSVLSGISLRSQATVWCVPARPRRTSALLGKAGVFLTLPRHTISSWWKRQVPDDGKRARSASDQMQPFRRSRWTSG